MAAWLANLLHPFKPNHLTTPLLVSPRTSPRFSSPHSKAAIQPRVRSPSLAHACTWNASSPIPIEHKDDHSRSKEGNKMDLLVPENLSTINSVLEFTAANFLPLALVSVVVFGLTCPNVGVFAHRCGFLKWSSSGIFLISGLTLHTGDIEKALETWPAALFGLASILLITPLAAALVLQLHLAPREFVKGLAVFCCVPTTLSSCVALTQLVGANSALALALTVTSNLLGVFTVPFMISKLVACGEGMLIPPGPLVTSLVKTLLIPLLIGKVLRDHFYGVADFVDKRRKQFSLLSSCCLILVPWMQVSCSRPLLLQVDAVCEDSEIAGKIAGINKSTSCGRILHLVFLAWNTAAMSVVHHHSESGLQDDRVSTTRSVIITASQKTLPVAVAVVGSLGGGLGEAGLLVLPCVAMHITQILIDSLLVNIWLQKDACKKIG